MKDIEWAKHQIDLRIVGDTDREDPQFYVDSGLSLALDFLNQLDEPETLSQEWIEEHDNPETLGEDDEFLLFRRSDIEKLLVPKQEKAVIPQFVADFIEKCKSPEGGELSLFGSIDEMPREVSRWMTFEVEGFGKGHELFVRAWLDYPNVEIEAERKYYAKIKGHELIDTNVESDPGDLTDPEWYRNIYFVQQMDGEIIIDMKDSGLRGAKHFMTKNEWAELGINDINADFEEVEE